MKTRDIMFGVFAIIFFITLINLMGTLFDIGVLLAFMSTLINIILFSVSLTGIISLLYSKK